MSNSVCGIPECQVNIPHRHATLANDSGVFCEMHDTLRARATCPECLYDRIAQLEAELAAKEQK